MIQVVRIMSPLQSVVSYLSRMNSTIHIKLLLSLKPFYLHCPEVTGLSHLRPFSVHSSQAA